MIKLNASASYDELADEFWVLYNARIPGISEVLEQEIDKRGWGSDFFTDADDDNPPATANQYSEVLKAAQDELSKLITGAVAKEIDSAARVTEIKADSFVIELDTMPDFDIQIKVEPRFASDK